jgi:hypothetical protein
MKAPDHGQACGNKTDGLDSENPDHTPSSSLSEKGQKGRQYKGSDGLPEREGAMEDGERNEVRTGIEVTQLHACGDQDEKCPV